MHTIKRRNDGTTTIEPGCYIDSHWGQYSIERLYDLVCELAPGYANSKQALEDGAIIQHSMNGEEGTVTDRNYTVEDCHDIVSSELYDELTDMLPTDPTRPHLAWQWHDGELFYTMPGYDMTTEDLRDWYNDTVGQMQRDADQAATLVIQQLAAEGWTQTDIGTIVGYTQQRISQLLHQ